MPRLTKPRLIAVVMILSTLAGCAQVRDSNFNPLNWFGRGTPAAPANDPNSAEAAKPVNPLIPRRRASVFRKEKDTSYRGSLVANVTEVRIDRVQGGAIVRATGVARGIGPFDARLVRAKEETQSGTITYEMRALQPAPGVGRGSTNARTLTVGAALSNQDLVGIRNIRVRSANNALVSRR